MLSDLMFSTTKEVASEHNKAIKRIFDALGKAASLTNAGGSIRATRNRVMQANSADYCVASLDALGRATGTFAKLLEKYPSQRTCVEPSSSAWVRLKGEGDTVMMVTAAAVSACLSKLLFTSPIHTVPLHSAAAPMLSNGLREVRAHQLGTRIAPVC